MFRSIVLVIALFTIGCAAQRPNLDNVFTKAMQQDLLEYDVVLLGERHDNRGHHDIQALVIDYLRDQNRLGGIYLEHLNQARAAALEGTSPKTARTFADAIAWKDSGWPGYEIFSGLFESLVKGGTLVSVGIDRERLFDYYRGIDPGLIPKASQAQMALNQPLSEPQHERLLQVLLESHCGQLTPSHGELMLKLQRYRDAYMAYRYKPEPGKTAVYVVGAGHSNAFYGVPHYLRLLHPELNILSIELAETGHSTLPDESDWAITTEPAERSDPCAHVTIRKPELSE